MSTLRVRAAHNDGAALLIALMAMLLILALGTALVLVTITETRIASSYGAGVEAFYAAEAAIDRAMDDLRAIPDWSGLGSGATLSTFVDGPPAGARTLPGGTTLDLTDATSAVRAGDRAGLEGQASPSWRLYAWGPLAAVLPVSMAGKEAPQAYVVVWIAPPSPGQDAGSLALLAHAYGALGVLRALEVIVTPVDLNGSREIRVVSWREGP